MRFPVRALAAAGAILAISTLQAEARRVARQKPIPSPIQVTALHCVGECSYEPAHAPKRATRTRHTPRAAKTHQRAPAGLALTTITAPHSRKQTRVAASHAHRFQGFVNDLEASGYRISIMTGWRSWGSCRGCDRHPKGLAIDIDQIARNKLIRGKRLPGNVTAIAARHGLFHGALWRNADGGHFEVQARNARAPWPRTLEVAGKPPEQAPPAPESAPPVASSHPEGPEAADDHANALHGAPAAEVAIGPPQPPATLAELFRRYLASRDVLAAGPWVRLTCADGSPMPEKLADMLQAAAERWQAKVYVNSAYRPREYNERLRRMGYGAARNSQHINCGRNRGAVDFRVAGVSSSDVRDWVRKNRGRWAIGGIGYYGPRGHVHADLGPSRTWTGGGKRKRHTRVAGLR